MKYFEYLNGGADLQMADLSLIADELDQRTANCRSRKSHTR